MAQELVMDAEKYAEKAEGLHAFSGIKLLHIRNKVEQILDLFGRNHIFDQYTKHDMTHIDRLLTIVMWIIPNETKDLMTHADWLMLVLSIYFHDMGLIVTDDEYSKCEHDVEFIKYKNNITSGQHDVEFKEKVEKLQDSQRFLYQEYVRKRHGERVKKWIEGGYDYNDVQCEAIYKEIKQLLHSLPPLFRRDLGLICESHHLDDLDDFKKYKTNQHYGDDSDETVNLHYIAIILRTADLLHITSDRTPSIQYRLINPTDPVSIIEWQKQSAVSSVQPKPACDSEGHINRELPMNTIEITAYFDEPDQAEAYFGLTSYIRYAEEQLRQSFKLIQESIKSQGTKDYKFPWEKIDSDNISTNGFEQKQFQFTLDQNNILQLLIGHTLYNDASVVIRELIQNGIDAIKLQKQIERELLVPETNGLISVHWDSKSRELTFYDNGTGMTVEDIENYLLKVGTSKYRTPEFIKKYPKFSSISRFGIGILTCFMVSDHIDIITTTHNDNTANFIAIRNAHGKYLLKRLPKDGVDEKIRNHGTLIKLYVRSDVDMSQLIESAEKWIVLPQCKVEILVDDEPPQVIGYENLTSVIQHYFESIDQEVDGTNIRIVEDSINDVTIAYAQEYYKYYNEWRFMEINRPIRYINTLHSIGTCVEGIRVEFNTPGYLDNSILAIVNISGKNNAHTNVARSAIENSPEHNSLLSNIYCLYVRGVKQEIHRYLKEGYSRVHAASTTQFLLKELIPYNTNSGEVRYDVKNQEILFQELAKIECAIIELDNEKKLMTAEEVHKLEPIHIVDGRMFTEAEYLLREISTEKSLGELMNFLGAEIQICEQQNLFSNFNKFNILHQHILSYKEVHSIRIDKDQRRIDIDYGTTQGLWKRYELDSDELAYRSSTANRTIYIPTRDMEISGLNDNEIGVSAIASTYCNFKSPLIQYIISTLTKLERDQQFYGNYMVNMFLRIILDRVRLKIGGKDENKAKIFEQYLSDRWNARRSMEQVEKFWSKIDKSELMSVMFQCEYSIYNPYEWSRDPQAEEKEYD